MGQGPSLRLWHDQVAAETRLTPGLFKYLKKETIVFIKPILLIPTHAWAPAENMERFSSKAEAIQYYAHLYVNLKFTTTKGITLGK